ncbi:hypothetical protein [Paracoccus yeei]|uniref:hypothetical protein n=1 Tax=Paracoccus yeei TaxID=147645 RepID=UPI003BF780BD
MAHEITWTVARFPDGSWTYGGLPGSPDYSECEIWRIWESDPKRAVKKAQQQRRNMLRREARRAAPSQKGEA